VLLSYIALLHISGGDRGFNFLIQFRPEVEDRLPNGLLLKTSESSDASVHVPYAVKIPVLARSPNVKDRRFEFC